MAWIRWRKTSDGRRLASLQWRDEEGRVHSKALRTSDERIAQMHLRLAERQEGKRRLWRCGAFGPGTMAIPPWRTLISRSPWVRL